MKITPGRLLFAVLALVAVVFIAVNRFGGSAPSGTAAQPQTVNSPSSAAASAGIGTPPPGSGTPASNIPADPDGDGAEDDEPPVMLTPTEKPDVKEAATAFAAAWLNTYRASPATWRAGLLDRVTPQLGADLAEADPASVPAGGRVGNPVKVIKEGVLLNAEVPVVTAGTSKPEPVGTLLLTLLEHDGTWLVSEIDWRDKK